MICLSFVTATDMFVAAVVCRFSRRKTVGGTPPVVIVAKRFDMLSLTTTVSEPAAKATSIGCRRILPCSLRVETRATSSIRRM